MMTILFNENGGAKSIVLSFAIGVMMILPMLFWDYDEPEYADLRQAERVVRHVSSEQQIDQSSFLMIEGEKTPSQFVNWMFSAFGTAGWHVSEDSMEFSPDEMKAIKRNSPVVPKNVDIFAYHPKFTRGKQVVVKADDSRRMLIAEAYLNPQKKPVFVSEWPFPNLEE
jgi:hypothetical protein